MSSKKAKTKEKTLRERQEERADFSGGKRRMTARDLLNSGLVGLWKDRTDIKDSVLFARELRKRAQERHWDDPEMNSYLKQAWERLSLEE